MTSPAGPEAAAGMQGQIMKAAGG
jgi:hypothetical protein